MDVLKTPNSKELLLTLEFGFSVKVGKKNKANTSNGAFTLNEEILIIEIFEYKSLLLSGLFP